MANSGDTSGSRPLSHERYSTPVSPVEIHRVLSEVFEGWEIGGRTIHIGHRASGQDGFVKKFTAGELVLYVPAVDALNRPVLIEGQTWLENPGQPLPRDVVHPTLSSLLTLVRGGLRGSTTMTSPTTTEEGRAQRRQMIEDLITCGTAADPVQAEGTRNRFVDAFRQYVQEPGREDLSIDTTALLNVCFELPDRTEQLFQRFSSDSQAPSPNE